MIFYLYYNILYYNINKLSKCGGGVFERFNILLNFFGGGARV